MTGHLAAPRPADAPLSPVLVPFRFTLPWDAAAGQMSHPPDLGWLESAIEAHLCGLGWPAAEPLRWAITAVDGDQGLELEGVAVCNAATDPQPR